MSIQNTPPFKIPTPFQKDPMVRTFFIQLVNFLKEALELLNNPFILKEEADILVGGPHSDASSLHTHADSHDAKQYSYLS